MRSIKLNNVKYIFNNNISFRRKRIANILPISKTSTKENLLGSTLKICYQLLYISNSPFCKRQTMDFKLDFDRISSTIISQSTEISDILDKCQVSCSIPSLSAFEEKFSIRYSPSLSKSTSEDADPSLIELSNAFRSLDKIPTCFAKPLKKQTSQTSLKYSSRRNETLPSLASSNSAKSSVEDVRFATDRQWKEGKAHEEKLERMLKSCTSVYLMDSLSKSNESVLSPAVSNSCISELSIQDVGSSIDRLYKDFKKRDKKFEEMFKSVKFEGLKAQHQFNDSVQELRRAFKDLEKLVPRGLEDCSDIFVDKEEQAIADLKEEIEALLCIQENKVLYQTVEMPDDADLDAISKMAANLLPI